jgi:hypothetical protein
MNSQSVIKAELERLARLNGGTLTPAQVVIAAEPKDSPLHDSFTWDDSAAATQYRLWQARQLLRVSVTVIVPDGPREDRAFVSLTTDRGKDGYRVTLDVLNDEDLRRQMLLDARAEMKIFANKYRRLTELSGIFAASDSAFEAIDRANQTPEQPATTAEAEPVGISE